MKKIHTLIALSFFTNGFAQHLSTEANYTLSVPFKSAMPKMSVENCFGFNLHYQPVEKIPLWITYDGTWGQYASQKITQTFGTSSGQPVNMPITYSSNMNLNMFGLKLMGRDKNKRVLPYINGSAGVCEMNSRIFIGDPDEKGGACKPLENKKTFSRTGFVYSVGGGININTRFFKQKDIFGARYVSTDSNFPCGFLNIGFNFTAGPAMDYINIKYMQDQPQTPMPSHSNPAPADPMTTNYYANFVNVSTNVVHEHKIAEVYKSPIKMWSIHVGYTFMF